MLKEWGKEQSRTRFGEKVLYTTTKDECYKLTQQGVHKVADLSSTQEEADTRMLLHACHASRTGHKSVILVSDDTDVLVISLATSDALTCDLFLKTGTKNRTSYINISQLARGLGSQLCQALPGLHAYTGCDTVSAFAGRGKVSALKLLQKNEKFCETFQKVGADWTITPELYAALQCKERHRILAVTSMLRFSH